MSDDHAAAAISAYGSRINRTPNIDRIALEGMRLDNCFCTNSICSPSRATILTGQYSHINGLRTLPEALDNSRQNVAKLLRTAGYQTAVVGKWHLHAEPAGFDYWNVLTAENGQGTYFDPAFDEMGKPRKYQGYATDIITSLSLEWLQRRDPDRPFFLMCHHKAPHRAWEPSPKYSSLFQDPIPEPPTLLDRYENRSRAASIATMRIGDHMNKADLKQDPPPGLSSDAFRRWAYQRYLQDYLRCVESIDEGVGRIHEYLDRTGLSRNTVLVYTSDQGMFLGEHGWFDKRFMYEESLRMPFLIRYPGEIRPGSRNDDIVLNLDFAPLFLDYARAAAPAEMQGCSFRLLLQGRRPKDWRSSMYYRYWMHLAHHGVPAHYGVRTKRFKLIYYYGRALGTKHSIDKPTPPEWELFDLKKDPGEMRNVYSEPSYREAVRELKVELARLQTLYRDIPCME